MQQQHGDTLAGTAWNSGVPKRNTGVSMHGTHGGDNCVPAATDEHAASDSKLADVHLATACIHIETSDMDFALESCMGQWRNSRTVIENILD